MDIFCQAFFKDVTLLPNHRFQMFCIVVFQITRIARDANPSPSCLQTTAASRIVQCSLHIPLQESRSPNLTTTRPVVLPPTNCT